MDPLQRLAETHVRAWQDLAASTAAMATLPLRSLQVLTGLGPAPEQTLEERLERARAEAEAARAELERRNADHVALVNELRRNFARLENDLAARLEQARDDQKRMLYGVLEPLLTQLPLVRRAVADGKEVEAADVLALLGPLDELLARLGFQPIGAVGEALPFDPTRHQVTAGVPPEPGTPVLVKYVGFELDARILRRARVTVSA